MRNLIDKYRVWRAVRRELKHRRWLLSNRVILPAPDRACQRNTTECV